MRFVLLVFHLLVTLALIGIVLLQKGEDSEGLSAGSAQGFGGRSAKSWITTATSVLATIFFLNCLFLAILVKKESFLHGTPEVPLEAGSPSQSPKEQSKP